MVNDDERREMARRLRESIPGDGVMRRGDKGWSLLYRTIFGHYMHHQSSGRTYSEVAGRLADLIDPDKKMAQDSPRHLEEAEASDGFVPQVDRDALLALASGLEASADRILKAAKSAQFGGGPRMGEAKHDADEWRSIASRIREACGEVDGHAQG